MNITEYLSGSRRLRRAQRGDERREAARATHTHTHRFADANRFTTLGFTIIELMVVIVVIAILAAISVVAYTNVQSRARVAAAQSELSNIRTKLLEHATFYGSLSEPNPQDHLESWRSILAESRVDSSSRYTVCGSADGSYATIGNIEEFRWLWAGDVVHFVDTRGNMREVAYTYDESIGGAHQNQHCRAMLGEDYEPGRSIPSPDLLVQ